MVYSPVARVLMALDLLQARPNVTAAQLADRLEVEPRSVRRYILTLRENGIPVEAVRGRYGGYRLRPGFKLPPLMWTEDEAMAITLGLRAAERLGFSQALPTVTSALAKVERVVPAPIRERIRALQESVVLDLAAPAPAEVGSLILRLSTATHQRTRVHLAYTSRQGEATARDFDCYGLVYHERWYAVGYCHLRRDLRTFRLDRIAHLDTGTERFMPPEAFDPLAYALDAFAAIPSRWLAEVLLRTTLAGVRGAVPAAFATLEETADGILLRAYDDDLRHTARFLVNLGCPFQVIGPPELTDALRALAQEILDRIAHPATPPVALGATQFPQNSSSSSR